MSFQIHGETPSGVCIAYVDGAEIGRAPNLNAAAALVHSWVKPVSVAEQLARLVLERAPDLYLSTVQDLRTHSAQGDKATGLIAEFCASQGHRIDHNVAVQVGITAIELKAGRRNAA
jgi:hypothetical protein